MLLYVQLLLVLLTSLYSCFICIAGTVKDTIDSQSGNGMKPLIVVATVDGRLSALSVDENGKLLWSVDLDQGPLVSSSISELAFKQDDKIIKLIPSLHGGLFKFDGENVEAVPFNADQLLSSSFRLAENAVLVGGKETSSMGIDMWNGKVLYSCSVKGCHQQQTVQKSGDVIVVKRQQQTIRSIENRNGHENWNFSVGEVDINFSQGSVARLLEGAVTLEPVSNNMKSHHHSNKDFSSKKEPFNVSDLSRIKVIVPDGTICMVTNENQHVVTWKHKFDSAITSAWLLLDDSLHKLDLFDSSRVPALDKDDSAISNSFSGVIYLGTHNDQVYIQASHSVQQVINQVATLALQSPSALVQYTPPRFSYRKCLASSKYLQLSTSDDTDQESSSALVEKHDVNTFPFLQSSMKDRGYYFQSDLSYYPSIQHTKRKGKDTVESFENHSHRESSIEVVYSSFLHWWKELLILTVTISISVQFFLAKLMHVFVLRKETTVLPTQYDKMLDENLTLNNLTSSERPYESRFLVDFEPQECLGKGGFGVVFKAKNKMDDCSYAVKRILLPNKQSARDKVLREVRALAKLEHRSIVRYFNAWSEQPPPGWQKKHDVNLIEGLSSWSISTFDEEKNLYQSSHSLSPSDANIDHNKSSRSLSVSPLSDRNYVPLSNLNQFDTSKGFNFSESITDITNDNQTHSWGESVNGFGCNVKGQNKFFDSSSSDLSPNVKVPFHNYQDDSLSIQFIESVGNQTSLCKVKSKVERNSTNLNSDINEVKVSISGSNVLENNSCKSSINEDSKEPEEQLLTTVYLYIQMQLCKKNSLREWLSSNISNRDRSVCINIFYQVIGAVDYVHKCGLIHRDLKPSNVFFSMDGTVKVGDFGLVTHSGEVASSKVTLYDDNSLDESHTKHVGTTMYMAPEQMMCGTYTEKVDIFALGLILFELSVTFKTQMERVRHLMNARRLSFPSEFSSKYIPEAKLVLSMLSKNAVNRPSAQEISENYLFSNI